MAEAVAEYIRSHKQAILDSWRREIERELTELASLSKPALIDHLPEFLDGLALWVEGDTRAARVGFEALADGHAIQRLGFGVDLRTLTREYGVLRSTMLRELLALEDASREALIRLNEGLDEAMRESVRRYAETRDHTRDLFIAILAHDLRNPLNAVALSAGALQLSPGTPAAKKSADLIATTTERMGRMVSDLMDLARGHLGGGIVVNLGPEDLGALTRHAVGELQIAHPQRRIELATSGDLRGAFDRTRIEQAMSNLIGNAIQHGEDPIEINVEEAPDRRALVTRVSSRGRTISTTELASFFDPFRQARRTNEGLGLGLYIVGQIALGHGARVDTSSQDGVTTFTVTWPRVRPEEISDDVRLQRDG